MGPLPAALSSRDIDISTFMVWRKHIPNGVLKLSIFPLLVHPDTQAVLLVPFTFWPGEMITLWREGHM